MSGSAWQCVRAVTVRDSAWQCVHAVTVRDSAWQCVHAVTVRWQCLAVCPCGDRA